MERVCNRKHSHIVGLAITVLRGMLARRGINFLRRTQRIRVGGAQLALLMEYLKGELTQKLKFHPFATQPSVVVGLVTFSNPENRSEERIPPTGGLQ